MPAGYLKIKESIKKEHPDWSDDKIEEVAAKIWNKNRKGKGDTVGKGRAESSETTIKKMV